MKKYTAIIEDLLKYGKSDLPNWNKEEFIVTCMLDYKVSRATATKVYDGYMDAVAQI